MADIRDCVRSLLPGRARLRHPMLFGLDAESCREVCGMLETVDGVTGASINPRTGSLLITWNEAETSSETLLETIEGFAAFFFADQAGSRRLQKTRRRTVPAGATARPPAPFGARAMLRNARSTR